MFSLPLLARLTCSVTVRAVRSASTGELRVTVSSDLPGAPLLLHWGVVPSSDSPGDSWTAPAGPLPAGTAAYDESAVQTALVGGAATLTFSSEAAPRPLNFVFFEPDANVWTHTGGNSPWHVPLDGASAPAAEDGWAALFASADSVDATSRGSLDVTVAVEAADGCSRVRVHTAARAAQEPGLLLHWGIVPRGGRSDLWLLPSRDSWPPGSTATDCNRALQSPLRPLPDGRLGLTLSLGPLASALVRSRSRAHAGRRWRTLGNAGLMALDAGLRAKRGC